MNRDGICYRGRALGHDFEVTTDGAVRIDGIDENTSKEDIGLIYQIALIRSGHEEGPV